MAGNYPNTPGRRMGLDQDGSVLLKWGPDTTNRLVIEGNATNRDNLNDEEGGTGSSTAWNAAVSGVNHGGRIMFAWIFPELRDLDGVFIARADGLGLTVLESSANTTTGADGTWTTEVANMPDHSTVRPTYRQSIQALGSSGKRGLRVTYLYNGGLWGDDQGLQAFHIYGEIAAGETPDRLIFIDETTGLEFTGPVDFAEVPRGSSEDFEWRIRNISAAETANTINYAAEDLYLGSGGWYTHTTPGGAVFSASQSLASLAPATTSGLITTRRVTPGGEDLGTHAGRIYLDVDSWT